MIDNINKEIIKPNIIFNNNTKRIATRDNIKSNIIFNNNTKRIVTRDKNLNLPFRIKKTEEGYTINRSLVSLKNNQKFQGFNLILKGRLKGNKRASNKKIMKGSVNVNTFNRSLQANIRPVQTRWGKWGTRLWVGYIT